MPTYQTITVDITPGAKEKPVLNASQFDNGRPFNVALTWGGVPFTDAGDFDIEIHVKKPDGNIVTAEPDSVVNEVCSFLTTEQMCACHGINECEIVLLDNDIQIGTGNFILDVEKAPDEGGIQSASEIANLEHQIEVIIPEVIGDDYYNKTQTDALLADKADKSDTYTKAQVDSALAAKANSSDLATVATSGDYDDLINKPTIPAAQVQSDYAQADNTQVDYIKNKPDIAGMIADALLAVMPVETSGPSSVCNFNTDIATNLVNVKCTIVATGGGGTPSTPIPIVGYTELNLTHNGTTDTIALGSTVYGGELDVTTGVLTITHGIVDLSALTWYKEGDAPNPDNFYAFINDRKSGDNINSICSAYPFSTGALNNFPNDKSYNFLTYRGDTDIYIRNSDYASATADDFKTSLSGVQLVYELATPQTVQLTPTQVQAILGDNNVFADTGDSTVQYKVSIQKYVDDQ